jgi:hypothetical protein
VCFKDCKGRIVLQQNKFLCFLVWKGLKTGRLFLVV